MRVLITGVAGFLGSHLADCFIAEGHQVVGLDNFLTGSPQNIAHLSGSDDFLLQEHDVTGFIDVEGELDGVLHFASPASPADYMRLPIQTLKVGSLGTHNALGLALAKEARFLLASTSEVYGDPAIHPQPESYWGHVNPVGPRGVYDEAKRFSEALTMAYHHCHSLDVRIARIFNTYGPRMRLDDGRAVSNFLVQAIRGKSLTIFGDGTQTRSFCYVDDMIEGLYHLFLSSFTEPINLGNPEEVSILELAALVREKTGSDVGIEHSDLPEDDPRVRQPDITVAREVLGWKPRVALEEGLKLSIPYFRKQIKETPRPPD